jgi:TupA-like ATPgrasp
MATQLAYDDAMPEAFGARQLGEGAHDLWHPGVTKARGQRMLKAVLGRVNYERLQFRRHVGYVPNLERPASFMEKIAWRKLYGQLPTAPLLSDKLAVREHVSRVAGSKYLNTLFDAVERPEAIDFNALPRSFVAKANHGSGMTMLIPDRCQINNEAVRARLGDYLAWNFGQETNEWWYQRIDRRILLEKLQHDDAYGVPQDYKFYVFNGVAKFVHVDVDRLGNHTCNFYDLDWQPASFRIAYQGDVEGPPVPRPSKLTEMKELAEALATDLDFVRVDLYCVNDEQVMFGEMTLAPGAGWAPFEPSEADATVGSYW